MVNLKMTTKYGAMVSAVFASILVAGVYFVRERSWRRKEEPPKFMRSMSMAVLHGGKLALKRLLEYHEARADKEALYQVECDLKAHLFTKKRPDYKKLQVWHLIVYIVHIMTFPFLFFFFTVLST